MIYTAFILGMATSLHCVGMCGPIALSLGLNGLKGVSLYVKNITYQLGRVTTYTLMGLIIGFFGQGFQLAVSQQSISIFVGIVMILMALLPKSIKSRAEAKNPFSKLLLKVKLNLGKLLGKNNLSSLYTIGLLNGLLPCGPVYIALTAAITNKTIVESMAFMFLYGMGTMPLMFITTHLGNIINAEFRNRIYRFYPIILLILGILFVLRGMELNIPYISPSYKSLQLNPQESCH